MATKMGFCSDVEGWEESLLLLLESISWEFSLGCKFCVEEKVLPKVDWLNSVAAVGLFSESVGDAALGEEVRALDSRLMEESSLSMDRCWLDWRSKILVSSWWLDS